MSISCGVDGRDWTSSAAVCQQIVQDIVERGVRPGENRVKSLIAIPVIGIGGGGLGRRRGQVIERQVALCAELAARHGVDIAIVTPDRAAYGAVQYLRTKTRGGCNWHLVPTTSRRRSRLGTLARQRPARTVPGRRGEHPGGAAPVGGSCSTSSRTVGWLATSPVLSALDQAQLIEMRSEPGELGKRVARIVRGLRVRAWPMRCCRGWALGKS